MNIRTYLTHSLSTLALLLTAATLPAAAQYQVVNLVSNQAGIAAHQDPSLVNAWGVAFSPTGPFWVSDEGTGVSTLYTGKGLKQSLVVSIPSASGQGPGSPTGIVFNSTSDFVVSQNGFSGPAAFLFDSLDGTISGWSANVNGTMAIVAASRSGAAYTGLAIGQNNGDNFLFAADNANNRVDVYDKNFNLVSFFTDATLPAGSNPYNVQNINGDLYVTFTNSTGGGAVDIFDTQGRLKKSLAKDGPLKAPWGVAKSPSNFGKASNAILIGNLADGRINAYSSGNGRFLGQLRDKAGKIISIDGLWSLTFGAGNPNNGKTNQLFFTAGPDDYVNGLFGVISQ